MSEWQPIDEAPRNGKAVCVGKRDIEGGWDMGFVRWSAWHESFITAHGWPCKPTHWIPLPPPPEIGR